MNLPSVAGIGMGPEGGRAPLLISEHSITLKGELNELGTEYFRKLFGACRCDTFWTYHSKDCKSFPGALMDTIRTKEASAEFMEKIGLNPTPDAVDQMALVFAKALRIMCERPWDPNGKTWRRSGFFGILHDVRKKFMRLWERGWEYGSFHEDSAIDLINYLGFLARSDQNNRWGEWGEPAGKAE